MERKAAGLELVDAGAGHDPVRDARPGAAGNVVRLDDVATEAELQHPLRELDVRDAALDDVRSAMHMYVVGAAHQLARSGAWLQGGVV